MNPTHASTGDASGRHATVLDWLQRPRADAGLRFAGDGDDWHVLSYEQLAGRVRRAAQRLRAAGVGPGDAVVLICPTSPEFVAGFFGALLCGATPTPLATLSAFRDRAAYVDHIERAARLVGACAVVAGTELAQRLAPALAVPVLPSSDVAGPELVDAAAPPSTGLFQFSSGSTGPQRAIRIPFDGLNANIHTVHRWLGYTDQDTVATWLPVHHDMGLVSSLLLPFLTETDVWLMRPEQFVHSPLRWLRCHAAGVTRSACPPFGLAYVVRRVRAEHLAGLDFSAWRSLVTGAERIDPTVLRSFVDLLAPFGFSPDALLPAYGLAEATLAVTGVRRGEPLRSVAVDTDSLGTGRPVRFVTTGERSLRLVDCGVALDGMRVAVVDDSGQPVAPGVLGEIVVSGGSLASGYLSDDGETPFATTIRTGDAGFLHDERLFVVGRIGDSMKLRGRWLFAEDLDRVAARVSRRPRKTVVLLGDEPLGATAIVAVEGGAGDTAGAVGRAVAERVVGARVRVIDVPPGWISVTTSGKLRRRAMWRCVHDDDARLVLAWKSHRDGDGGD
jgi:acyl-CoA synthetase (AMP-forming)/AMP-acid ligase II